MRPPVPTEHQEQAALMQMARLHTGRYPALALLHAIPNGGHRSKVTAGKMKAEGVAPGVPDLCLPVARAGYHGLYIELKRQRGGRVSPEQGQWHFRLRAEGYRVDVCRGADEAWACLMDYLAAP